jgi:hypothetical protein
MLKGHESIEDISLRGAELAERLEHSGTMRSLTRLEEVELEAIEEYLAAVTDAELRLGAKLALVSQVAS